MYGSQHLPALFGRPRYGQSVFAKLFYLNSTARPNDVFLCDPVNRATYGLPDVRLRSPHLHMSHFCIHRWLNLCLSHAGARVRADRSWELFVLSKAVQCSTGWFCSRHRGMHCLRASLRIFVFFTAIRSIPIRFHWIRFDDGATDVISFASRAIR